MLNILKIAILVSVLFSSGILNAQEIINGKIIARDLLTHDAQKASKFYTELFGWKAFQKTNLIELKKDGLVVANIVEVDEKHHPLWVPLITHNDFTLAKKKILNNGGTVLKDVKDKENIGDFLLVQDQEKALFVIVKPSAYKKPTGFIEENEWLWDEVWSHNVEGSAAFYQEVFAYELEKTPSGYVLFKNGNTWLAGLLNNPYEKSQTQWASTIRVKDTKAMAEKAVQLGGKILVNIEESEAHAAEVILADPMGAVFIIEKYEEKVPR
jgi:predicted enzyme related to lactoylglutathione lyase